MQDANEQADGATLRERVQRLAPSPRCIADTGLGETLLAELLCKHLLDAGALDLPRMASRLRLPGIVLDEVLNGLRQDGRIEVLGQGQGQTLRYGLTERGREATRDALQRSGYLGPAPFAVDAYRSLLRLQTVHASRVDRQAIREAMRDVVLSDDMLDRLGVALNSNRALMLYGPPGTGKTFIASRLIRLFEEAIWVPHAIAIDDAIVPIYDAQIHRRLEDDATRNNLLLGEGIDRRLACCLRPQLRVGGELGMDQLDIRHDPVARLFHAPLQLKAANGLFVIDDLGRQRMPPEQLFNRWIVPLEKSAKTSSTWAAGVIAACRSTCCWCFRPTSTRWIWPTAPSCAGSVTSCTSATPMRRPSSASGAWSRRAFTSISTRRCWPMS